MEKYTQAEILTARNYCKHDFLFFIKYMFFHTYGVRFMVNSHHIEIAETMEKVVSGEIRRLIINIPPRYSKTEMAVQMFMAWGLFLNPKSKFINISYSDSLALKSSSVVREMIMSNPFQQLRPLKLKKDSRAKGHWVTEENGEVYATSSGGAITGFGAGILEAKEFSGAIIIDDPLKAEDSFYDVRRDIVNRRFTSTIQTRVNDKNTPIIVIMQRLHEDDLSGFLLNGGNKEEWCNLCMPAINESGEPLWESKHSLEALIAKEQSDPFTFSGQYMQKPTPFGGGAIKLEWFKYFNEPPQFKNIYMSWDTAIKTTGTADFTAGLVFGEADNGYYLIDAYHGKVEYPDLKRVFLSMASKHKCNAILVEDKASGQQLIQDMRRDTSYPIIAIKATAGTTKGQGKIERIAASTPTIEAGKIFLQDGQAINAALLAECQAYPLGKNDDIIDALAQFINWIRKRHSKLVIIDPNQ